MGGHCSAEAGIVLGLKSSGGEDSGNLVEENRAKPVEEEESPAMQEEEVEMLFIGFDVSFQTLLSSSFGTNTDPENGQ